MIHKKVWSTMGLLAEFVAALAVGWFAVKTALAVAWYSALHPSIAIATGVFAVAIFEVALNLILHRRLVGSVHQTSGVWLWRCAWCLAGDAVGIAAAVVAADRVTGNVLITVAAGAAAVALTAADVHGIVGAGIWRRKVHLRAASIRKARQQQPA